MLSAEGGTGSAAILGLLNVEGTEFMMILLVALLVFGPERLPEVARKAAKAITSVRRMSDAFQNELRSAVDLPIDPLIKAQSGSSLGDVMNRLTAEAEAEEAAKKLADREENPEPEAVADEVPDETEVSDAAAPSDETSVPADPFAGSVRDPFPTEPVTPTEPLADSAPVDGGVVDDTAADGEVVDDG